MRQRWPGNTGVKGEGMIIFRAARPGAWLREDIADILTALAAGATDDSYVAALCAVALALGLRMEMPAETLTVEVVR